MHKEKEGLERIGEEIEVRIKAIVGMGSWSMTPNEIFIYCQGEFRPEAIDWYAFLDEATFLETEMLIMHSVKRRWACGDKGIASKTETGHDSTMTTLKVPTEMVFCEG
jgi:N-carbamoyl-L-amino-acid hydrolase